MSCELSPQGRAFSTVLTAFVGSIINGLSSGALVAFMTAWISWFAVLRVLSGALYGLYKTFSFDYQGLSEDDVTFLGWAGWLYTAIYSPIVHVLWIVENWAAASGQLHIVRGLAISISALSLTIDIKTRYATKLSETKYLGTPASVAFKLITAFSAFGMGLMCAALLIKGYLDLKLPWYFILIYCIFSVIWAAVSYSICPVQDGGMKGYPLIAGLAMGAFAGVFLAAPAFAVMQTAEESTITQDSSGAFKFTTPESGQASLRDYLSCDSVATWQKFVAIFP